ncbi:telomerase-binding protein EST1A isoform X2 [Paramormyrops kingsleyae]|uniref:telomerase-binding protein EST1A isoform X2 n=1 Tax=Paramormyrops kingsleyae TaxID=1676925 RepID=UPI003B96FEBD
MVKMADELDRVRISAAELRATVTSLTNNEQNHGAGESTDASEGNPSQRSFEGKRPDIQLYRPRMGQDRHCQDTPTCSADKERDAQGDKPSEHQGCPGKDAEAEQDVSSVQHMEMETESAPEGDQNVATPNTQDCALSEGPKTPDSALSDGDCGSVNDGTSRFAVSSSLPAGSKHYPETKCRSDCEFVPLKSINHCVDPGRQPDTSHCTSPAGTDTSSRSGEPPKQPQVTNSRILASTLSCGSTSPKPGRRIRKPDREIYQPRAGRLQQQQGSKEMALSKEPEKTETGEEPKKSSHPEGHSREGVKDSALIKEPERSGPGEEEPKKKSKSRREVGCPPTDVSIAVDHLTGSLESMKMSETGDNEAKKAGKRGGEEDNAGSSRRKTGEGRRSRAGGGGGEGGNGGCLGEAGRKGVEKKEKGSRRSKGRDREGDKDLKKRGKEVEGRKEIEPDDGKGKGRGGDGIGDSGRVKSRAKDGGKDGDRERLKDAERERGQDGGGRLPLGGGSRAGQVSKRYSKSGKRCPRNRTCSTSSASSGTSMDGPGEEARRRGHLAMARDQGEGKGRERLDWGGKQQRDNISRGFSSTDSLEESETGHNVRGRRLRDSDRHREDPWSPERRLGVNRRGSRGGAGGQSEGVQRSLLVPPPDPPQSITTAGDDLSRRQEGGSRGRGRGILVLPTRTDLTMPPESSPRQLTGVGRGSAGPVRGRGGRGGATRRLWDPNNPDQKPALVHSHQSQHVGLKQPLHLQQQGQGNFGQLHFLDTDDEIAGSPPVHQGELYHGYHTSQQNATMAYYKFQNSDNPYFYQSPSTTTRYPYPYGVNYQMPGANGMYPSPTGSFYTGYPPAVPALTPEEAEVQTRGELGKLLRVADNQELQLSNLLSRDKLSPEGLERTAQLRAELLTLYERVILTDIEFSDSQNLDQALWKNVFYQVIERFRQLLRESTTDDESRIKKMLLTLLDEGVVFFDALLQKLQVVFQFKLEDYMDGVAIRARPLRKTVKYALISAQRCMICQGDIARYREQASDSANYGKARSWYLKAQHIAPKNGRPYNQLALLAVYTKRKLDAVYYYMRSLAASNPILTAKESLMSLFEETKRKAEQLEQRHRLEPVGPSRGPRGGGRRGQEPARIEIWVRPGGQPAATSRTTSESGHEVERDGELEGLSTSDLNKRFVLSFLHTHGKLFTRVGLETFPMVASRVLQEFRALLQHSPSPLGSSRMLQIVTINMFAVHNAQSKEGQDEVRSPLQEQSTALGLAMFALLVQRCTELLRDTPTSPRSPDNEEADLPVEGGGMPRVSDFPPDLRELLPCVKVWSDWMLGHPKQWNSPPSNLPPPCSSPDVWQCLADLCNELARVHLGEVPLYKADGDGDTDEELQLLVLDEDRALAGFVPLLGAPQEPCYTERGTDLGIAADCKRVTVLKYFLEALCGQEEPLLAFKGGKYVSVATLPPPSLGTEAGNRQGKQADNQEQDVIVEAESSQSLSEGEVDGDGSEDDIRELRARRHALAHKLALQQKRQDKIQAVLQTCRQLELEIRPLFLVPDTNGFIDHLAGLQSLLACGLYILVVPLIVITELDGLARGQEHRGGGRAVPGEHARALQERAKAAVSFLERGFEAREPCLRAMTSRGNQLESIAFRSEDTSGQQGNNDDLILSCCLHYCKDKAKDFMPTQRDEPVRLHREVVLLTDDRNLRVKALTRNVPVRDIPAFLRWAKVG